MAMGSKPELISKRKRSPSPPRRGRAFASAAEHSPFGDYFQSGRSCPLSLGGEGLLNEDGLLSPALSSIVPLEEREQAPCAFAEEFCLAPCANRG